MKRCLLVFVALTGLLLAGCGDDSSSSPDAEGASDTTSAPAADPYGAPPETTAAPADTASAVVALAEVDGVGEALVGPDGRTLYLFEQDSGTTSACTGGCADVWPPLVADGEPTAGEGLDSGLLSTADGGQVVFNGHLLYSFSGDAAAGEANGVGIPGWLPVDAAGNGIS